MESGSQTPIDFRALPVFSRSPWQMSYGERAALEGMLQLLTPRLSLEVGRAEGGSLQRIAAHSGHVVSFDLVEATEAINALPNVEIHVGDSHGQLPEELARFAAEARNVDFALIDGDHSAAGVRADMLNLLESPAVKTCVILAHDSLNEEVRAGLDEVPYEDYEKVAFVDLDFVPGFVAKLDPYRGHCWGGFGLVVVDESRSFAAGEVRNQTPFPHPDVVWQWAQAQRAQGVANAAAVPDSGGGPQAADADGLRAEVAALQAELDLHRRWLGSMQRSASWRLTAPLRSAKRRLRDAR